MFTLKLKSIAVVAAMFALITVSSCNDDHDDPKPEEVTITLSSPAAGAVIKQGETLHINGSITAPSELHGYDLIIRRISDDSIFYFTNNHDHSSTIQIHEHWENTTAVTADMEVEIVTAIDHSGNTKSKKAAFKIQP